MKHNDAALNAIRGDILMDTKAFLKSLDSGAPVEELSLILTKIKEKEALLIKKGGVMMAPDLWKLLYNRLASKLKRSSPSEKE